MSERVANTKVFVGVGMSLSRHGRRAVEEAQWQQGIRDLYGDDADGLIARADELSLTTAMNRHEARDKAEQETLDVYTVRLRAMGIRVLAPLEYRGSTPRSSVSTLMSNDDPPSVSHE